MEETRDERLSTELALLESMYPEQTSFDEHAQELHYKATGGSMRLRIPTSYLVEAAAPEVLSANAGRSDVRDQLQAEILRCQHGEEMLDSILLAFNDLLLLQAEEHALPTSTASAASHAAASASSSRKATVIIYLHHLLAASKRKQAVSPLSGRVSGVTKPGYPGVMVFSGPAEEVHEHVGTLKQLKWQAFQVRMESEEEWMFQHRREGVREVETMGELVEEVGTETGRKEIFMEAMKMK